MPTIIINTQGDLDALPESFSKFTILEIRGGTASNKIIVRKLWGNVHAVLRDNAHVVLWGNAHAVLRDNAHVVLWGNAHAVLRDNAHAVLRDNARAELWGNARAELWDNAHAVLRGNAVGHVQGDGNTIELFAYAVAFLISAAKKVTRHGGNTTVVKPKPAVGVAGWLGTNAVKVTGEKVILFKRVSAELKTQETTPNETLWAVGAKVEHLAWKPKDEECGAGKYHACSRPYFCDEFRSRSDDRYVAISVDVSDLYAWPNPQYPHKIAFRAGVVLYECDQYGVRTAENSA